MSNSAFWEELLLEQWFSTFLDLRDPSLESSHPSITFVKRAAPSFKNKFIHYSAYPLAGWEGTVGGGGGTSLPLSTQLINLPSHTLWHSSEDLAAPQDAPAPWFRVTILEPWGNLSVVLHCFAGTSINFNENQFFHVFSLCYVETFDVSLVWSTANHFYVLKWTTTNFKNKKNKILSICSNTKLVEANGTACTEFSKIQPRDVKVTLCVFTDHCKVTYFYLKIPKLS